MNDHELIKLISEKMNAKNVVIIAINDDGIRAIQNVDFIHACGILSVAQAHFHNQLFTKKDL